MALGELYWPDDLAEDLANTGVYEGLLVSHPTHAPGGISAMPKAAVLMDPDYVAVGSATRSIIG